MDRRKFLVLASGPALGLVAGCAKTMSAAKPPYADAALCGKCGQIKGSPMCCKPGQPMCEKCGLAKDSPGCCKMKKGEAAAICGKCGQIKGSDLCCKPGQEKCPMCGLTKGSPGCCTINKPVAAKM